MKKYLKKSWIVGIVCVLLFCSCGKEEEKNASSKTEESNAEVGQEAGETSLYSWKEIQDGVKNVEEKLKSGAYENLKGEIEVQLPEFDSVSAVTISYPNNGSSLKEFIEDACELIQKIRGEVHRDQIEITGMEWDMGIFATDIEEEIEAGDSIYENYTGMLYHGEKELGEYMQLTPSKISTWTNGGVISSMTNEEELSLHPCLHGYEGEYYSLRKGEIPDITCPLLDGEVSAKEAVETFEDCINVDENYFFNNPNPDVTYEVVGLQTCKIQEDLYAYYFQLAQQYKGISVDTFDQRRSGAYEVPGFDYPESSPCLSKAMMIEKGRLDCTMDCDRVCQTEETGEAITEARSLDDLLMELSGKLTAGTTFEVLEIEFIYQEKEVAGDDRDVVYEWTPVWKIYCQNKQDLGYYDFYIDPVTGYTQAREEH